MSRLACRSCGRQVHATPPAASLFAEERRCPRCGVPMLPERREAERRVRARRQRPPHDPGPSAATGERRVADRRVAERRLAASSLEA